MAAIEYGLDNELGKQILLWTEGWLDRGLTDHFYFDGHTFESVFHNTRKLSVAKLIRVIGPKKVGRKLRGYWPVELTPIGRKFLTAAKDERRWAEAVETVRAQGGSETFTPLVEALLRTEA